MLLVYNTPNRVCYTSREHERAQDEVIVSDTRHSNGDRGFEGDPTDAIDAARTR